MNLDALLSTLDVIALQQPMLATFADVGLKSVIILTVGYLTVAFFYKGSASTTSLIWRMAFFALLLLPILSSFLPKLPILVHGYQPNSNLLTVYGNQEAASYVIQFLITAYWIVTAGLVAYLGLGLYKTGLISKKARPLNSKRIQNLLNAAQKQNGSSHKIELLVSHSVTSPVVWGMQKHRLIFPASVFKWDDKLIAQVIGHELGHIQRGDWTQQILARLTLCIYWPNPLVIIAARRMAIETEKACDDFAIDDTGCRVSYAENLVWLSQQFSMPSSHSPLVNLVGEQNALVERIHYILSEDKQQHWINRDSCIPNLLMALILATPISATSFTLEERVFSSNQKPFPVKYFAYDSKESQLFRTELERYLAKQ